MVPEIVGLHYDCFPRRLLVYKLAHAAVGGARGEPVLDDIYQPNEMDLVQLVNMQLRLQLDDRCALEKKHH